MVSPRPTKRCNNPFSQTLQRRSKKGTHPFAPFCSVESNVFHSTVRADRCAEHQTGHETFGATCAPQHPPRPFAPQRLLHGVALSATPPPLNRSICFMGWLCVAGGSATLLHHAPHALIRDGASSCAMFSCAQVIGLVMFNADESVRCVCVCTCVCVCIFFFGHQLLSDWQCQAQAHEQASG